MRARGAGQICSTSSLSGLIPAPSLGPYTTSKFAVVGLSLALRAEAATYGVRVSVLCPASSRPAARQRLHGRGAHRA
jgi:short-subunit dehydrogenase